MDKLWKFGVIGLLAFLIGSVTVVSGASHSAYYLTNEAGTNSAKVDARGRLQVRAAGKVAIRGVSKVNVLNTNRDWWEDHTVISPLPLGFASEVLTVGLDETLIVTDLTATFIGTQPAETVARFSVQRNTGLLGCAFGGTTVMGFNVVGNDSTSVNLSTGIRFGPNAKLCGKVSGVPLGTELNVYLTGYKY